jgi:hypothetical protein
MLPEPSLATFLNLPQSEIWAMLQEWWWLFLIVETVWLGKVMLFLWYHWRKDVYDKTCAMVLLEVKIPEEVLEPLRAMEAVITGFWQISSDPNWYEKWWEGQSGFSFTLEIASIEGVPHFYVRSEKRFRAMLESQIYSQYPKAEIAEADDYTKNVPQDIPNDKWEMWSTAYKNTAHNAYPIRTYQEFETGREEEEKRVDPIASLLEAMARLKTGEQVWVQLRCFPLLEDAIPLKKEARVFRDKLARREVAEYQSKSLFEEAWGFLLTGKFSEPPKEEKQVLPPEMKLTPGEKEILGAVERKIGKLWFLCNLKYLYLAKREALFMPNVRAVMSYFANYVTDNMNALVPHGSTLTKVKKNWYDWFWFNKQRLFLRKRKLFRAHVNRVWYYFPKPGFSGLANSNERFILDAEEIATLYHFPGRTVAPAPTLPRVEAKKSEPPLELPVE